MKNFISFCFALLIFFSFSQSAQAEVLTYTPTSTGINYGYGSSLVRINDGNISTSGTNDYQVHPTNAIGKTITMTFENSVVINNAEFHNRIACCSNRIAESQMVFRDAAGTILYTYVFPGTVGNGNSTANLITITDPAGDIPNVKSVELTNFQSNPQNFREIIFNGNLISPTNLRITEVEYDTIQGGNDGSYEWIELYNYGTEDVNLENWTITDANPTTVTLPNLNIPAGAYVVLANNPTNFQINYPGAIAAVDLSPTLGLSNAGDTLTLRNPLGDDIDLVAWEGSTAGWDLTAAADAGESICRTDNDVDTDAPEDFIVCTNPSPRGSDITPPSQPTIPDLTTESGSSLLDNITNSDTPSFDVICSESTSTITLQEGTTILGTVACSSIGTTSITSSELAEGVHSISYTETDQFSNESEPSPALAITIDTVAPSITEFTADTDGVFSVDSPNLEFTATDTSEILTYEISIDGEDFTTTTSPFNPTIPTAASHTVTVRVTDLAGNQSLSTIEFPPVVSIISPTILSNGAITDGTITVNGPNDITLVTVSDNASNLNCGTLPAPTPVTCSFQVDTTGTVTASAVDTSTATGFTTRDYLVDTIFPVISFNDEVAVGPTESDIVIIDVLEANFMAQYDYGFSPDSTCDDSDAFTENFTSLEQLVFLDEDNNGNYLCVRASDAFGNTSYLSSVNPLNIDITPPNPPVITSNQNPITGTGTPGDTVEFMTDSGTACITTVQSDSTWECTLAPDPIPGEGYSATAVDQLGNTSNTIEGLIFNPPSGSTKGGSRRITQKELGDIFGTEPKTIDQEQLIIDLQKQLDKLMKEQPNCYINYTRLIKKKMTGEDVRQVQICMNSLGYFSGPEDAIYGSLTYKGITSYQKDKNLIYVDGIVGPETSKSLNSLSNVVIN